MAISTQESVDLRDKVIERVRGEFPAGLCFWLNLGVDRIPAIQFKKNVYVVYYTYKFYDDRVTITNNGNVVSLMFNSQWSEEKKIDYVCADMLRRVRYRNEAASQFRMNNPCEYYDLLRNLHERLELLEAKQGIA